MVGSHWLSRQNRAYALCGAQSVVIGEPAKGALVPGGAVVKPFAPMRKFAQGLGLTATLKGTDQSTTCLMPVRFVDGVPGHQTVAGSVASGFSEL